MYLRNFKGYDPGNRGGSGWQDRGSSGGGYGYVHM